MALSENKKYVTCEIDKKEYCVVNGQFNRYLSSINLSLPQYLEDHEKIRCRCKYCGNYAGVKAGFIPKDTCGSNQCAKQARAAGFTDEVKAKISRSSKALFSNVEWAKQQQEKMHNGNKVVGADGLTGYERTKMKREQVMLEKYGHAQFANWNKTKQTWQNKTDEEKDKYARETSARLMAIPAEKKKRVADGIARRNLQKFGVVCPANLFPQFGSSKIAAKLFSSIDAESAMFKPKTTEKSVGRALVDFCIGNKVIEFYGDYWHANPAKFKPDDKVGKGQWPAKDIWKKDAERIQKIEAEGYQVKIVWERDFKRHPEKIIKECKEWLNSI